MSNTPASRSSRHKRRRTEESDSTLPVSTPPLRPTSSSSNRRAPLSRAEKIAPIIQLMHASRWSFADLTAAWLEYNTENSTARKKAKATDILNVIFADNDTVGLLGEDERWQETIIKAAVTNIRRELDHLQETSPSDICNIRALGNGIRTDKDSNL